MSAKQSRCARTCNLGPSNVRRRAHEETAHILEGARVQVGSSKNLGKLGLLLFKYFVRCFELLLQQRALEACLLLQLEDGGLKTRVEVVALLLHLGEPLREHLLLPLEVLELLVRLHEPLLRQLQSHLVLLVVAHLLPQHLHFLHVMRGRSPCCACGQHLCSLRNAWGHMS